MKLTNNMVLSMNLSPELCILSETVQQINILYHNANSGLYENQLP